MNVVATLPLRLLRMPTRRRLVLVLGTLVVSLGFYALAFPATYLGGVLLLPLVLCAWLFGWQGGLLCIAGIVLIVGASYEVSFGGTFWSSVLFVSFVTRILYGLAVCLAVGVLRRMTDTLLDAQHKITQTEQAYQQELTLNQLKDQALQDISHELRTPLMQIQGYLDLLTTWQERLDCATQAHFIAQAQNGCDELLSLIETVLGSAPEAKPPLHLQVFSLRHEVQTVVAHFDPRMLQDYHLDLDLPELLLVRADPRFVRQIVRNLLTNACKYTPPRTNITVSAAPWLPKDAQQAHTSMICVRVCDEGPGIPPEQLPLLFQRFVRLPHAAASKQPGTGLGLAICKQLVEVMGGSIWVESTGQNGEGCCFSFTLASGLAAGAEDQVKRDGGGNDRAKKIPHGTHEQHAVSSLRRGG
jgi:signal transduction histidine kinase